MRLLCIAAILTFNLQISASPAEDTHRSIREAYVSNDLAAVTRQLTQLRDADPRSFVANNYDYLLARTAERTGDFAAAMASYQSVADRGSILKEYALYRMAMIAGASGNHILERLFLMQLVAIFPESLLARAADARFARSYTESGNYRFVVDGGRLPAISADPGNFFPSVTAKSLIRKELAIRAKAHLQLGDTERARSAFAELTEGTDDPSQPDDLALEGVRGLDVIDRTVGGEGLKTPRLAASEHLRRAAVYQFNRQFVEARGHYLAVVNDHSSDQSIPDAMYMIGRGHAQRSEFADAIVWFERLLERFPDHPSAKDALLHAASAYARNGKYRESIARYQRYIERYPDDASVDRAYLNPVDILRDQRQDTEALRRAAETQARFRGKVGEAQALFAEARIYLAREDWEKAIDTLQRSMPLADLGEARVPGGTNRAEVRFLIAFSLERVGRVSEAISQYLAIADGRREYYGWRATERLRELAINESTRPAVTAALAALSADLNSKDADTRRKAIQSAIRMTIDEGARERLLNSLREVYAELPAYSKLPRFTFVDRSRKEPAEKPKRQTGAARHRRIAEELLFLGLYDEAAPELEAGRLPASPDDRYTLAVVYTRGGKAYRGFDLIEPLWRNVPADFQIELIPADAAELLFPVPYADHILASALPQSLDPRFITAIMRQESGFRPDARSNAAARGLMQFISSTAERIAGELGRKNFDQDDLYDPATAILFGSQYAGGLLRLFPNQYQAAAASYNGGEENMKRWIGRASSDLPDRYVPEIAYSQTKDYVYKVMANYRVYRTLYDDKLKLR